jgi:hypothetical protein
MTPGSQDKRRGGSSADGSSNTQCRAQNKADGARETPRIQIVFELQATL